VNFVQTFETESVFDKNSMYAEEIFMDSFDFC